MDAVSHGYLKNMYFGIARDKEGTDLLEVCVCVCMCVCVCALRAMRVPVPVHACMHACVRVCSWALLLAFVMSVVRRYPRPGLCVRAPAL
jgi:hypothetical protein